MLERSVFTIMLGCNQWIIFKRLGQGQSIVPWIFFYFSPVVNRNHTVLGLFFFFWPRMITISQLIVWIKNLCELFPNRWMRHDDQEICVA